MVIAVMSWFLTQCIYTSVDKGTQAVIQNLFALSVQSEIKTVPMQKQRGGDHCGLFAIATATALAFGVDPAELTFQQDAMRTHVLKCFEEGLMTLFPFIHSFIHSFLNGCFSNTGGHL